MPKVGIPYRSVDGSASLEDVANHFQVSPIAIATASLPAEDGKRQMLLIETVVKGHQERRISALGGHGFAVFSPPGHWPIRGHPKKSCSKGILELSRLPGIKRIFAMKY